MVVVYQSFIKIFIYFTEKQADPTQKQRHEDAVIAWTWFVKLKMKLKT